MGKWLQTLTIAIIATVASPSFATAPHSDYGCPLETSIVARLDEKTALDDGRGMCGYTFLIQQRDPGVPFPLKFSFTDCTDHWLSVVENQTYWGLLYFEAIGTQVDGSMVCSARFEPVQ